MMIIFIMETFGQKLDSSKMLRDFLRHVFAGYFGEVSDFGGSASMCIVNSIDFDDQVAVDDVALKFVVKGAVHDE